MENRPCFLLVCYDIANARRLKRVAKTMEAYGLRVQRSVFECRLDTRLRRQMLREVRQIMDNASDNVRLYAICRACERRREGIGTAVIEPEPRVFIV